MSFKGINSNEKCIATTGSICLNIENYKHDFHIINESSNIPFDGILGNDFLKLSEALINYKNSTLELGNGSVIKLFSNPGNNPIFTLNPRSETFLNVEVINSQIHEGITPEIVVRDGVYLSKVMTTVNKDNKALVSILNTTEKHVDINKIKLKLDPIPSDSKIFPIATSNDILTETRIGNYCQHVDSPPCHNDLELISKVISNLESKMTTLSHLTSSHRVKRGWINGIGTIFKTVIGTLDANDVKYYDESINKIMTDDKNIQILMKDQVQVVKTTISNFNDSIQILQATQDTLNLNFNKLKLFMNKTDNKLRANDFSITLLEQFTLMNNIGTSLLIEVEETIDAILFAKRSILHPSVISPTNIYLELEKEFKNIPIGKEFALPVNMENIHTLIDLATLDVFYVNNNLIFKINMPLVTHTLYLIYHVIPLPIRHANSDTFAFIQPTIPYLAISSNQLLYVPLQNLDNCQALSKEHHICNNHIQYSTLQTPTCETSLLTTIKKSIPTSCNTKLVHGTLELWQDLKNNKWIYIYSNAIKITIDCKNQELQDAELAGTGILQLESNCKAYAGLIQLIAKSEYISTYSTPMQTLNIVEDDCCLANKFNNSEEIHLAPIHLTNMRLEDLKLASHKLDKFNEEIVRMQSGPYIVRYPSTFQSIFGGITGLVLLYLMYRVGKFLLKRCSQSSPNICIRIFNQCNTRSQSSTQVSSDIKMSELSTIREYRDIEKPRSDVSPPRVRTSRITGRRSSRETRLNMSN